VALTTGARIGPYEITSQLGEGGMGIVYRAHDTKLGRDVAIKALPDAFANDPDRLQRFQREAQVLASLNHPNIAQIYGLEESDKTRCNGGIQPRWRFDGKELYFIAPDSKLMAASVTITGPTFASGTPVALFPVAIAPGAGTNKQEYVVSRWPVPDQSTGGNIHHPDHPDPELEAQTMTFTAGTKLGPYEILSAIGAGGMGEVYKARDTASGTVTDGLRLFCGEPCIAFCTWTNGGLIP
jgi:serine/threonine protein kinase